jgi:formylglycine-generating enzyme required for sulfatase activity
MKHNLTLLAILICQCTFGQINIKDINRSLAKINDTLYASKYEVSNQLYGAFINSLKKNHKDDELIIAKIDSLKWLSKDSYNKPYEFYYHLHPAFSDYPVVNITYDGAVLFCKWLTDEYNSSPKRKFKKVIFRLPSEEEWMIAAKGGKDSAQYSWISDDVKDIKSNIMCNFRRTEEGRVAYYTVWVKTYQPNGYGLYNMCGNVAEMLNDKKMVKGGSWQDTIENLRIDAQKSYERTAMTTVGFRYFMEVIEK